MAWLTRVNWTSSEAPLHTDLNNIGTDIRTWGDHVDAGSKNLSNLGAVSFHSAGYLNETLRVLKVQAGIGPIINFDNGDVNVDSGGELRHTAGTVRGKLKMIVGASPFGTDFVFESAGQTMARIKNGVAGFDLTSPLAAGTGVSPVFNLQNAATNVDDGVEIRHTAGTIRGALRMLIGASPFGTDFVFISNGATIFRVNSNGRVAFVGLPTSATGLTSNEIWHDLTTNAIRRVP